MKIRFLYTAMCIIFLFMVYPMSSFATINEQYQQAITVRGTITDLTGEPLVGVSVVIKGTTVGVSTDADGRYEISVPNSDAVLEITYIGFQPQEIKVGNRTTIDVVLDEVGQNLEEVVVVGYGVQKKINLTGAVSAVGSEKLANRPVSNLSSSLAGLAPGVRVTQGSGRPGAESVSINIRGIASMNASSPMILVDGSVADMTVINPDDVESVTFLKDAASAAIYGSRAANGVVLVTTKKGKREKPRVTFSALFAEDKPITSLNFMSSTADWMHLHNVARLNQSPGDAVNIYNQSSIDAWRAANADPNGIYTDPVTGNQVPNWLAFPNTDWATVMYKPSFYHRYGLTISGGSDTNTYLLSASFQDRPGALENTGINRFNIRANVDVKVNDFLTIGTQTYGTKEFADPGNASMDYFYQAVPAIMPKYNGLYGSSEETTVSSINNLLAMNAETGGQREYSRINTTWYANAKIWDGFSLEGKFNYSEYQRQDNTYSTYIPKYRFRESLTTPAVQATSLANANSYRYSYFSTSYTANLMLRYMKSFGDHDISAFAAYEQYYSKTSGFSATKKGLLDWNVTDITSAAEMYAIGGNSKQELGMLSYFGRINYAYKNRYLFDFSLRSDASSRFAPGHRWGTFPAFSAAWRISEEPFFEPYKGVVNNLKLKGSWGKLGNQVSGYYDWQSIYANGNYVLNEQIQNAVILSQLPNYQLSWEKTATTNLGFEAHFLNQRLGVEFDYFVRKTTDMLVTPPIYPVMGNVTAPSVNDAEMRNNGFDINVTWNDKVKDFRYSVGINAGYNTNKITKYKGALKYEQDESTLDIWGNPTWRYTNMGDVMNSTSSSNPIVEGKMYNEFFLRKPYSGSGTYMGADGKVDPNGGPKDGMIRTKADLDWVRAMQAAGYKFFSTSGTEVGAGGGKIWYGEVLMADLNGDGRYGTADDREFLGKSTYPKWTFGLNISGEWKGIDLNMSWSGRLGSYSFINSRGVNSPIISNPIDALPADAYSLFYSYDAAAAFSDPDYDPANDPNANINAKYPRLLAGSSTMPSSTFYLYNTSFLKLKTIQLGYTFPRKWLSGAKIANLRVFVAAENILTIKNGDYPGVDPELGNSISAYPISKSISGGLTVTF